MLLLGGRQLTAPATPLSFLKVALRKVRLEIRVRSNDQGHSPFICNGLGSRNTKGMTFSVQAKASSLSRTVREDSRS